MTSRLGATTPSAGAAGSVGSLPAARAAPAVLHGNPTRPLLAAALAAALFVAMDATIKALSPRYGVPQLTFFRFASGGIFAAALWLAWRTPMPGPAQWRMHLARSALLLVTLTAYFYALSVLPLAQTVAMGYTAPIFISLLAMWALGERPSRWIWLALGLGLAGAGVALWPELQRSGNTRILGLAAAAVSAVAFAGVMVLTRHQAQRDALPTFLLLQNLLPTVLLAAPAAYTWREVAAADLPAIGLVGALATAALLCITWAIRHLEASRIAPVEYSGLLWAGLIGYTVFGEVPTAYTALSAGLIVGGCLLLLRR